MILISEYKGIPENQPFYLTPTNIVLFYPLYQYTPYYYGIPKFEIPYNQINSLINPNGPLTAINKKGF
jgi:hypothetical protein